jgi:hypothetical protein
VLVILPCARREAQGETDITVSSSANITHISHGWLTSYRVDSYAQVTLVGLSKNHAMTFCYPATTRRTSTHGPTATALSLAAVIPRAPVPSENSGPSGEVNEKCWWAPDPALSANGAGDKLTRRP